MDYAQLFQWANLGILPAWLLLLVLPRHPLTVKLIHSSAYSVVYALAYLLLLITTWGEVALDFSNLSSVQALFQHPGVLLAGWIHYLAFDLFIGAWALRDSWQYGIRHWLMIPVLLLCFNFGPVGLLLYMVYKVYHLKPKA
jgi:hypothetical protein